MKFKTHLEPLVEFHKDLDNNSTFSSGSQSEWSGISEDEIDTMPTIKKRYSPQPRVPKSVQANEGSSYMMTGAVSVGDDTLYSMSSALPAEHTSGNDDLPVMSSALPAEQTSVDQAVSGGKRKCEKAKERPSKKTCKRGDKTPKDGKQSAQAAEPSGT